MQPFAGGISHAERPAHLTGIVTPEAVVLEFETAGVGSRLLAKFLDLLIQGAVLWATIFATALIGLAGGGSGSAAVIFLLVIFFLVIFGYPIGFEALTGGRTPGKMALGLRVVTTEGAPARFRHAVIRAVIGLVDFFLPPGGAVATVAVLLSKDNQRLGDMAAGTIVLRERTSKQVTIAMVFPVPYGYGAYVSSLNVRSLGPGQYGVVRSFLLRVHELTPAARWALSGRLATVVSRQVGQGPDRGMNAELYLACVAAAYQVHHRG